MPTIHHATMHRLLLFLIAASSASAAPASVPHYAEFGSWLVACDNMRSCEARGFDGKTEADLRVVRDAGETPVRIALTVSGRLDPDTLHLDGAPLHLAAGWTLKQEDGLATLSTVDPSAVRAFLRQVRDARRITFGAEDAGVPLDGLTAALLRMDDVQGRAGTPTPLMAAAGPNAVAEAPSLPGRPAWRPPAALSERQASVLAATTRMAQSQGRILRPDRWRPSSRTRCEARGGHPVLHEPRVPVLVARLHRPA